jgi:CheY-like chemotaxis protein
MPEPAAEFPNRQWEMIQQAAALQQSDRCKGKLIATLAHDLRNCLAPISNALELCQHLDADEGKFLELHQIMRRQVEEMTRLLDDLLDVSRIARDDIELNEEPVDPEQVSAKADVMLPFPTTPSDKDDVTQHTCSDAQTGELPRLKILVVDDVRSSGKTLALMLEAIGHHANVLDNGAAAVDWIVGNRPDVVFLDIAMPGMSGFDVAREIRRHEEFRNLHLVAMTGYSGDVDRRSALASGFDDHLAKPTSLDTLRELIITIPRRLHSRERPGSK